MAEPMAGHNLVNEAHPLISQKWQQDAGLNLGFSPEIRRSDLADVSTVASPG
jgi:hypothetical protein